MDKNLALRIKQIREYRNYTQAYMASRLKLSQNAYSKLESGITPVTTERLLEIANIIDVPADKILNDNFELFYLDRKNKNGSNDVSQMQQTISVLTDEVHYLREQNLSLIRALERRF